MLELEEGDPKYPSGNLLAYSMVEGINPIQRGGKIIVCNVMISYIAARQNHFPVIIFAPISLKNRDELEAMIRLKEDYDIYRLDDFSLPSDLKMEDYVKDRMERFNEMVIEYVDMCRASVQERSGFPILAHESESGEEQDDHFEHSADANREGRIDFLGIMENEEKSLNLLEKFVADQGMRAGRGMHHFRQLVELFEDKYPKYDIRNLERAVLESIQQEQDYVEDLGQLYLDKYRAIYWEQYEKAQVIQNRIRTVETNGSG